MNTTEDRAVSVAVENKVSSFILVLTQTAIVFLLTTIKFGSRNVRIFRNRKLRFFAETHTSDNNLLSDESLTLDLVVGSKKSNFKQISSSRQSKSQRRQKKPNRSIKVEIFVFASWPNNRPFNHPNSDTWRAQRRAIDERSTATDKRERSERRESVKFDIFATIWNFASFWKREALSKSLIH